MQPVKENGVLNGFKSGREIMKGEDCERSFSHIKEKVVLNIQEGTFSLMMFFRKLIVRPASSRWI